MHAYVKSLWWSRLPYHTQSLIIPFLGKTLTFALTSSTKKESITAFCTSRFVGLYFETIILYVWPDPLHKNASPNASAKQETARALWCQDIGSTIAAWSTTPWLLMTLGWSIKKDSVEHLISVLKEDFKINMDWEGTQYLMPTIDWDYVKCKVHLSMSGCVKKLCVLAHKLPNKSQMQPHNPQLQHKQDKMQSKQHISRYILSWQGEHLTSCWCPPTQWAVDSTLQFALNSLAAAHAKPTAYTIELIKWLLKCTATNLNAILTYKRKW